MLFIYFKDFYINEMAENGYTILKILPYKRGRKPEFYNVIVWQDVNVRKTSSFWDTALLICDKAQNKKAGLQFGEGKRLQSHHLVKSHWSEHDFHTYIPIPKDLQVDFSRLSCLRKTE